MRRRRRREGGSQRRSHAYIIPTPTVNLQGEKLHGGTCSASLSSGGASSSHPDGHYFTPACMSVFLCRPLAGASVSPLHLVLVSQAPPHPPVLPEEGAAFFGPLVSKHIALIFHRCAFFLLLLLLFSLSCVCL